MSKYLPILIFLLFGYRNSTYGHGVPTSNLCKSVNNSRNDIEIDMFRDWTPHDSIMDKPVMGGPANVEIGFVEPESGTFYLVSNFGNQNFKVDSSQVVNNSIHFQKTEGYPQ